MTEKLLKVDEVSEFLDLKPARIYELCRRDKNFPVVLVGSRQYRFSETALLNWIQQGGNRQIEGGENGK